MRRESEREAGQDSELESELKSETDRARDSASGTQSAISVVGRLNVQLSRAYGRRRVARTCHIMAQRLLRRESAP